MTPKRILCLFDYNATTGFATVSHNIVDRLLKHYGAALHLHIVACNYFGEPYDTDEGRVKVFPAPRMEEGSEKFHDVYGRKFFMLLLANNDYDGVFIMQDPGVICEGMMVDYRHLMQHKKHNNRKQPKSILYYPIDYLLFEKHFLEGFSTFDKLVAYTDYARQQTVKLFPELRSRLTNIPHGVNIKDFHPLSKSERNIARKELFGENADKFIFLNLNRNQFRKDIPTTIWAFEEFKLRCGESKSKSFLYLHMSPSDEMGWDLKRVLAQTSLQEGIDYSFAKEEFYSAQASVADVNSIYNACDAYITTTTGGGWELSITEAMACGLPVVAPLHTSIIEISDKGERLFGLTNTYPYCSRYDNTKRYQCDYLEVADMMQEVADNPKLVASTVERAFNYSQQLNWDVVCIEWIALFKKMFF